LEVLWVVLFWEVLWVEELESLAHPSFLWLFIVWIGLFCHHTRRLLD
jgi:hypothetical protein